MRHTKYLQEENSEDSFLDVVANVVGVLIILVMVVGAQASRGLLVTEPVETVEVVAAVQQDQEFVQEDVEDDLNALRAELKQAERETAADERALGEIQTRVVKIAQETQAYDQQRVELAMHRSIIEEELQRRKNELDKQKQAEFEVQRELLETQLELEELTKEQMALLSTPDEVTEIECVPTPLARIVEGKAIHLRLSKGLVSVVPFEELMEEVQQNIQNTVRRVQERGQVVETYGPLAGYRLKLTMAQRRAQNAVSGPIAGQIQRVSLDWEAEIIPVATEFGQHVEQALLPGGALQRFLSEHGRERPDVVVWLYADSFDEFRPLKRALYEQGFSLATRPMKPGINIKASPKGTRAAAQ